MASRQFPVKPYEILLKIRMRLGAFAQRHKRHTRLRRSVFRGTLDLVQGKSLEQARSEELRRLEQVRVDEVAHQTQRAERSTHLPRQVWLFRLKASTQDAERYARQHLAEQEASVGFYQVHRHDDDCLLEIHLGGDGSWAYLPALLKPLEERHDEHVVQGVINASEQPLSVELGPGGLRTLALTPDLPVEGPILEPVPAKMHRYHPAPERTLQSTALALAALSLLALFVAMFSRPVPDPITIPQSTEHSPAEILEQQILPRHDEPEGTLRFDGEHFEYQPADEQETP